MQNQRYIYADNAATTPLSPAALEAMTPYLTSKFANPGGIHRAAKEAAADLQRMRAEFAKLLGTASPREIIFTSGGSESNNLALQGAVRAFRERWGADAPVRIITSQIEHHAILHTCEALATEGVETTLLPVDHEGFVSVHDLEQALAHNEEANAELGCSAPATALVSIMLANNEVGTIQNIAELASAAHRHGAPIHTDAVQAVGHIPVDVQSLGVDALSLSAHKFQGPRGVGALYVKSGLELKPLICGGGQEFGLRSGTENLAGIAGMQAALAEATRDLGAQASALSMLRDDLVQHVLGCTSDVLLTGPTIIANRLFTGLTSTATRPFTGSPNTARRLPSIASFICKDVDAELLCVILDKMGVAAATGSACSAGSTEPSHVAKALGYTDLAWAHGTLRISLASDTTPDDIELLKERIPRAITQARLLSGAL